MPYVEQKGLFYLGAGERQVRENLWPLQFKLATEGCSIVSYLRRNGTCTAVCQKLYQSIEHAGRKSVVQRTPPLPLFL